LNLVLTGFSVLSVFFGSLECRTENVSFISVLKKPEPNFITVPSVRLVRFRFSVSSVRFLGSGSFCPGLRGGPGPTMGVRTVYTGVRRSSVGVRTTVDAMEYITFSRHVAASDPPMWWSLALLWTQNSRLRLGRAVAWSHTQHFYHATKG
jgi:hypothetical protein